MAHNFSELGGCEMGPSGSSWGGDGGHQVICPPPGDSKGRNPALAAAISDALFSRAVGVMGGFAVTGGFAGIQGDPRAAAAGKMELGKT